MIRFGDAGGVNSNRLKFGAGNDLHIYHNGTNSTIREEGDGDLLLHTNNGSAIKLTSGSDENMIVANQDGAVELYHNNSKKLETTSGGVTISGDLDTGGNDIVTNNGAFIASDADGAFANRTGSNIDHIWHNDTDNAWNFCSDTTYKGAGNSTLNCTKVNVKTSGGIDFSATGGPTNGTGDSELLNDYEEGSWTPLVTFGGGASGQSYTHQVGRYVKVGRLVHIQCYVVFSDKGSSTGTAKLANLPYATRNQSNMYPSAAIAYFHNGSNSAGPGSISTFMVYGEVNETNLNIQREEVNDSTPEMNDAQDYNFADNSEFMLTMTYVTN